MKFDLNREIKGLTGNTFNIEEGKKLTLLGVIHHALRAPVLHEQGQMAGSPRPLTPADLNEREKIIEAIKGDILDIKPEQIVTLRKLVGASGLVPEVCLAVSMLLNAGDDGLQQEARG